MNNVTDTINQMLLEQKAKAVEYSMTGNNYGEEIAVDTMVTLKNVAERLDILEDVKHNFI